MKANDLVKVRYPHGGWRHGVCQGLKSPMQGWPTLVTVAVGEPHYFNYEVRDFDRGDVKRYEPVTEEAEAANQALAPTVLEAVNQALADLLPTETAELKEEAVVSAYYGAVTLEPCIYEQETIGAFREIAGWSVTVWRRFPATRHSPEEMSDSPIGSFPNYAQAIQKFVETVFACKAEDYWQHKADEAMAEAWAAGEM